MTNISHDLRTPMTLILGYLCLLKDAQHQDAAQWKQYVDIAYHKADSLEHLIEDLFQFTHLSHRDIPLKKTRAISIRRLLQQRTEEMTPLAEADTIRVTIANRSEPIPETERERLFDRFYRLDKTRASETGGSGLGLAIAKRIVELHDGAIGCDGEGSEVRFWVRLVESQCRKAFGPAKRIRPWAKDSGRRRARRRRSSLRR